MNIGSGLSSFPVGAGSAMTWPIYDAGRIEAASRVSSGGSAGGSAGFLDGARAPLALRDARSESSSSTPPPSSPTYSPSFSNPSRIFLADGTLLVGWRIDILA